MLLLSKVLTAILTENKRSDMNCYSIADDCGDPGTCSSYPIPHSLKPLFSLLSHPDGGIVFAHSDDKMFI